MTVQEAPARHDLTPGPDIEDPAAPGPAHPTRARTALSAYHRRARRRTATILGLFLATAVAFVLAMMTGPIPLSAHEILTVLMGGGSEQQQLIVTSLRLPPALLAALVGAALSLAGLQMQTILDNPLAEPFTLGISAAAACGAALAIVSGLTIAAMPEATLSVAACTMALAAGGIIVLAARSRRAGRETMILLGIALVFGFQAVLALLQYSSSAEALQQIVFWSLGSMVRANWTSILFISIALAVIGALFWRNSWKLTALRLGEARASAMGIQVSRLRMWSLAGVSVLAALSVSAVGVIGFVGLVGPHVARILVGEDQRFLLPASIAVGALLLTGAHAISQVVIPGVVLPAGIITSIVGVPFFIALVIGRRRTGGTTR